MRVLLLGHNKWACLTVRALLESKHEIVGIITETDEFDKKEAAVYERFARHGAYESLKELALNLKLPLYQPQDIHAPEFIAVIENQLRPDLIVCVSYHTILKEPLLRRYPNRIINAHLAPLPHYRGRAPLNWAIINGEDHTAVTVHFIDEGIDTGPIIVQEKIPITEDDRAIDVLLRALPYFPKLVLQAIDLIESGKVQPHPQSLYEGSYFPKRTPEDGLINWEHMNTRDIHNMIRALADPYPGAFCYHNGRKVVFQRSRLPKEELKRITPAAGLIFAKMPDGAIKVATIDGYIIIQSIQVETQEEKRPADYFKLGSRFSTRP
jgi:methionyl-tRNA formyltransferase